MNSAVMAQLHCGYRDRGRVRPLVSYLAVRLAEGSLPLENPSKNGAV